MKEEDLPYTKTPSAEGEPSISIAMNAQGFVPTTTRINVGDIVQFINEDSTGRWPASDLHPTHELYPEFDPGEPVPPGASWSFRFEEKGSWRFHDHLKPNKRGNILVE